MTKFPKPYGGYASAPEAHPEKYQLRVGEKVSQMSRWRDAILSHLFGCWSGKTRAQNTTSIWFGALGLSLDLATNTYDMVYGDSSDVVGSYYGNYTLDVQNGRLEVQDALVRFAKDIRLGQIRIHFPDGGVLYLWQKERHSEYGCSYVKPHHS